MNRRWGLVSQARTASSGWLCLNNDIVASWMQCILCSCLSDFCKLVLEVMMMILLSHVLENSVWTISIQCEQWLGHGRYHTTRYTNTYLTCQWWMRMKSTAWNYVDVDQECKELVAYEHSKCEYYEKAFSKHVSYLESCVIGEDK